MNTGLLVISRAPVMSKKVSYSLEQSLLNTPHGNSIALFTIIESLFTERVFAKNMADLFSDALDHSI
jgi:hypothetical protein